MEKQMFNIFIIQVGLEEEARQIREAQRKR